MNSNINIPEYGVSQFNKAIKDIIEDHFSYVRIKGEISEIRVATKGQIYITLKDKNSILSAVVWEQKKRSLIFEWGSLPLVGHVFGALSSINENDCCKTT